MRAPSIVIVAFVAAGLIGCAQPRAAAPAAEPPSGAEADARDSVERLTLTAGNITFRDARVDGTRLRGVNHELNHFDDGYRGSSPSGYVFLSEQSPGLISGVIGNGAVTSLDYQADPSSGRIHAQGRWGWKRFGLEVDRNRITVSRRFCSDTYRRVNEASDEFFGSPDCWQGGRRGVHLRVPDAFFQRPAGEQVVFLTAFLM